MDDFVAAAPAGSGAVYVAWSDGVARTIHGAVCEFVTALDSDRGRRGFLRRSLTDWRLFGHAYPDRRRSKRFRAAHAAQMRAILADAARRALHTWPQGPEFLLDASSVADWFAVCGQAQWLFIDRWSPNPLQGSFGRGAAFWLHQLQDEIAVAACDPAQAQPRPS